MAKVPQAQEHAAGAPFDPGVENATLAAFKAFLEGSNLDKYNLSTNTVRCPMSVSRTNITGAAGAGAPDAAGVTVWQAEFECDTKIESLQLYVGTFGGAATNCKLRVRAYIAGTTTWHVLGEVSLGAAGHTKTAINLDVPADTPVQLNVYCLAGGADWDDVTTGIDLATQIQAVT